MKNNKIIILGGAGLVGQNLIYQLKNKGYSHIVVFDKHRENLAVLRKLQPDIIAEYADLAESGSWQDHFNEAETVIMLQAQISSMKEDDFLRNNVHSTSNALNAMRKYKVPYVILVSSSVIESVADDFYTHTKKQQEDLVVQSGLPYLVLRPTVMFGWFDRKHFGWLSRFMKKSPVFPIPGYHSCIRQPLYVADFCNIIINCIQTRVYGKIYNISGREKIDFIDIIREIKRATKSNILILRLPIKLFFGLLWMWSLVNKNPPFTTQQLTALIANDEFEVIDWPEIFQAPCTPFKEAIAETFTDPKHSKVILEF